MFSKLVKSSTLEIEVFAKVILCLIFPSYRTCHRCCIFSFINDIYIFSKSYGLFFFLLILFYYRVDKVQVGTCMLQQPPPGRSVPLQGSLRLAWGPFFYLDATQRAFLVSGQMQVMEEMLRARVVLNQEELGKKIAFLKVNCFSFIKSVIIQCNHFTDDFKFLKVK